MAVPSGRYLSTVAGVAGGLVAQESWGGRGATVSVKATRAMRLTQMSDDDSEVDSSTELELVDGPAAKRRRRVAPGDESDASSGTRLRPPLEGVSIAISGIQNPRRSKLREIALRLGGSYSAAWDDRITTHLICAFAGTPKFNEVSAKGRGTIVRPEWLEQCDQEGHRVAETEFVLQSARNTGRLRRRGSDTTGAAPAAAATAAAAAATATADTPTAAVAPIAADAGAAPAASAASAASVAPTTGADTLLDSGDETEDVEGCDLSDTLAHGNQPARGKAAAKPADPSSSSSSSDEEDGWASDSTELLPDAELNRLHRASSSSSSCAAAPGRWSCPGLAGSGLSLPDFFRGVVAYLPRTAGWAAQQPPLDYQSVLRMLVANGAEMQTQSSDGATHLVCESATRNTTAAAAGGGGGGGGKDGGADGGEGSSAAVRVDATWVYACHRAGRKLSARRHAPSAVASAS